MGTRSYGERTGLDTKNRPPDYLQRPSTKMDASSSTPFWFPAWRSKSGSAPRLLGHIHHDRDAAVVANQLARPLHELVHRRRTGWHADERGSHRTRFSLVIGPKPQPFNGFIELAAQKHLVHAVCVHHSTDDQRFYLERTFLPARFVRQHDHKPTHTSSGLRECLEIFVVSLRLVGILCWSAHDPQQGHYAECFHHAG